MRVYEAKIVYSLVSLGEEVRLDRPEKVADYLRSAFDENPMQEAFYCVYLDRKISRSHPCQRHGFGGRAQPPQRRPCTQRGRRSDYSRPA
jgi:hypothetical protein